jgi:hypothetical protein
MNRRSYANRTKTKQDLLGPFPVSSDLRNEAKARHVWSSDFRQLAGRENRCFAWEAKYAGPELRISTGKQRPVDSTKQPLYRRARRVRGLR